LWLLILCDTKSVSICRPRQLRVLDDSPLSETTLGDISASDGNRNFRISVDFQLVLDGLSIEHYFGRLGEVRVPDNIESLAFLVLPFMRRSGL
jgi:hypothetical protein